MMLSVKCANMILPKVANKTHDHPDTQEGMLI